MPLYQYKAVDRNNKTVSGLIEAPTEDFAVDTLREKGLKIISLSSKSEFDLKKILRIFNRVKPKDLVVFSRQFSVLISANVAMVQSLRILADQTENPYFKSIVFEIAEEVDGGLRLSEALAKRPEIFSNFFISVIKSGESSGKLDEVLEYLATEMEKDYDMMSKIKGAMIYPAFVLGGLGIVGLVMMIFVVPKLTAILTETGTELPMATKILIASSNFITKFWWLLLVLVIGIAIGFKILFNHPQGKKILDIIKLRIPVFGRLFKMIYLVRFTRSMNTLIVGGVNITQGLEITAEVVDNEIYRDLIQKTIKEVEDGNSISSVFSESKEIPKMVSQMMIIGEKTGKLDVIFESITRFYSREIDNMVANLMTLMEPIIMVVLGIGVGLMVAAIIMPMYNMASNF